MLNQLPPPKREHGFLFTIMVALICAGIVRSFFCEPFHIPSSSMKPGLLIGDYIFVSKYSYGYSRYSFPFGLKIFEGRIWRSQPKRGDVIVFRLPSNTKINYVKRLIGLPGDKIQMHNGILYINDQEVVKVENGMFVDEVLGEKVDIKKFFETFPEGKKIETLDENPNTPQDNTGIYEVPIGHYFMMGDNRDNSEDSRFINELGFVPEENFVGPARIIFFSTSSPIWQFWHWPNSIRFKRIFQKIE